MSIIKIITWEISKHPHETLSYELKRLHDYFLVAKSPPSPIPLQKVMEEVVKHREDTSVPLWQKTSVYKMLWHMAAYHSTFHNYVKNLIPDEHELPEMYGHPRVLDASKDMNRFPQHKNHDSIFKPFENIDRILETDVVRALHALLRRSPILSGEDELRLYKNLTTAYISSDIVKYVLHGVLESLHEIPLNLVLIWNRIYPRLDFVGCKVVSPSDQLIFARCM